MVRIYLDLETYRPGEAFIDERIIACGLLIDESPFREESLNEECEPVVLSEWRGLDERSIVEEVHERVAEAQESHKFTVVCGFNILRFDIPLLMCRAAQFSPERYEVLARKWYNCFVIDHFQQLLAANNNRFSGLSLKRVVEVARELGLNPPEHARSGEEVKGLYESGRYKEIEDHLVEDLKIIRWLDLYGTRRLIEASVREGRALFF